MAENVGGIYWTAEMQTGQLLQAEKDIQRTTTKAAQGFTRVSSVYERMGGKITKTSKGVSQAMSGVGRGAGMAGIQVQQFVGQIQGGQSALLALSQQGADLGFVLGSAGLGAAIGIAATALSFLVPDLVSAETAADTLEKAMSALSRTAELGANGILEYSDEVERLAKVSQLAAAGRAEAAIKAAEDAAAAASQSIREQFEDNLGLDGWFASLEGSVQSAMDFGDATGPMLKLGVSMGENNAIAEELANQLGVTGESARETGGEIIELIAATQQFKTPESFIALEERLMELRETAGFSARNAIDNLINAISEFTDKGVRAGKTAAAIKKDMEDGIVNPTDKAAEASAEYTSRLQAQIIEMQNGAQAAEVYSTVQALVGTEMEDQLPTIIALINKKYELSRAQQAAKDEAKDEAEAYSQLESDYKQFLKALEEGERIKQKRRQQAQNTAEGDLGLTDMQALEQRYQQEREKLLEAQRLGIESTISYEERLTELKRQYAERRKQITDDEAQSVIAGYATLASGASTAFGALASVLENSEGEQSAAYKAMFALSKGFAVAQAGLNLSLAISQALADPSALTLQQKLANYAAIASAGGALISAISGASYGGGRLYGGAVSAGKMYEVNENGRPEMLMQGGKQYLLPNSRGEVVSNKDMMQQGGGMTVVNVYNQASNSQVNQTEKTDAQGRKVVDIVVSDLRKRGRIHKAIGETTTASNKI